MALHVILYKTTVPVTAHKVLPDILYSLIFLPASHLNLPLPLSSPLHYALLSPPLLSSGSDEWIIKGTNVYGS